MTRKDYILLAAALKLNRPDDKQSTRFDQWTDDCHAIANALNKDNYLFRADTFYKACGL